MRWLAILAAVFVLNAAPAFAQLPSQLRSAGVTDAEWRVARETIQREARLRGQREAVIRTLAIEIFEAQPDQPFETYVALIEAGAERLPQALAAAQALDPGRDPDLRRLKTRAVRAARDGRLQEALRAQDEYAAELQAAIAQLTERPQLELAAAHAAAAETASVLADFRGAAARYELAANAAPESQPLVRWRYRMAQAQALLDRGVLFADFGALQESMRVSFRHALPLAPRETHLAEHAATVLAAASAALEGAQLDYLNGELELRAPFARLDELMPELEARDTQAWADAIILEARVFTFLTEVGSSEGFGDDQANLLNLQDANIYPRETHPERWADIQTYVADSWLVWARLVDANYTHARGMRAAAAYRAAMGVYTPERAPRQWAALQERLALALWVSEHDLVGAADALDAALSVHRRDTTPGAWAGTQLRRGMIFLGATERGDASAMGIAIEAYRNALTIYAPEQAWARWAEARIGLGRALIARGDEGDTMEAEAAFSIVLNRADEHDYLYQSRARFGLAMLRASQGRVDEARELAGLALEFFDQSVRYADREAVRRFLASLPN